jgi:S-DNA-T family DNA segregation ATPase FtsK/SpoIIIE
MKSKEEALRASEADEKEKDIKVQSGLEFYYDGPAHGRPDPSIFSRSQLVDGKAEDFSGISQTLVEQLAEFKIFGDITHVTRGPLVTTFEFKPAPGTKVSKISALGEDLARLLKAQSLRVIAPIPGKDTVGFEVPNAKRATIGFADLLMAPEFRSSKVRLPIAMGCDIFGKPVIQDLADMPHLLVAGSTGSGKSVFMNTLIGSLIARHSAQTLRFVMIDPKMVELAAYNSLPHMACPVITDPSVEALSVLNGLVNEMENRYRNMRSVGARNIDSFNDIIKTRKRSEFVDFEGRFAPMPYIVVIIDEMADMMMNLGKEAEAPIARLAQKARAAGIHMVIATQRPTADVVTGLIKANFPTRVAFRVLSGIDSRTILDQNGAEGLLGRGDMLFLSSAGPSRLHGAFLSESEVHAMVAKAKARKT